MNEDDGEQITVVARRILKLGVIHTYTNIDLADSYSIGDHVYGSETG